MVKLGVCLVTLGLGGCLHRGAAPEASTVGAPAMGGNHAGARKVIEEAASGLDAGQRARAIASLIAQEPTVQVWGARGVYDPDPWVQRRALEALVVHPDPAARDLVVGLASRPGTRPAVACLAAGTLGKDAPEAVREAVAARLQGAAEYDRAPCGLAGARLGIPGALETGIAALQEGALPLDIDFLRDARGWTDPAWVAALEGALELVEPEMRAPLAGALLWLGSGAAQTVLAADLNNADPMVRFAALDAVSHGPENVAMPLLRRAGDDPGVRLARVGLGEVDVGLLQAALFAEDRDQRADGLMALGTLLARPTDNRKLHRMAPELIRKGLLDPDETVRLAALFAAAESKNPSLISVVETVMAAEESEGRVRLEAALCLVRLSAPRGD